MNLNRINQILDRPTQFPQFRFGFLYRHLERRRIIQNRINLVGQIAHRVNRQHRSAELLYHRLFQPLG